MIGARDILPPGGMTAEERKGFRIACACLATWGFQLAGAPSLGGSHAEDEVRARFRKHGRVVAAMASALDRTVGQGPITQDIPVEAMIEIASPG